MLNDRVCMVKKFIFFCLNHFNINIKNIVVHFYHLSNQKESFVFIQPLSPCITTATIVTFPVVVVLLKVVSHLNVLYWKIPKVIVIYHQDKEYSLFLCRFSVIVRSKKKDERR